MKITKLITIAFGLTLMTAGLFAQSQTYVNETLGCNRFIETFNLLHNCNPNNDGKTNFSIKYIYDINPSYVKCYDNDKQKTKTCNKCGHVFFFRYNKSCYSLRV